MLTIQYVNPTGMFCFGKSEDTSFDKLGKVHLVGENMDKQGVSNGSGKSSLFNAVCEILFQENPTRVSGDGVVNKMWKNGAAGRLQFRNSLGETYRVTYCRKAKKTPYKADNDVAADYKGTALFFDKFEDGTWRDQRGASMSETSKRIQVAVGLTYSQFMAISYMSPKVSNLLLSGTNKDRMTLLSDLVGLEEWDQVSTNLREKRKAIEKYAQEAKDQVSFYEGQLQTYITQINDAKAQNWEGQKTAYIQQADEFGSRIAEKKAEVDRLQTLVEEKKSKLTEESFDHILTEARSLEAQVQGIRARARSLMVAPDDRELADALYAATAEYDRASATLDVYLEDNSHLDGERCPTCNSKITKAAKEKLEKKKLELGNLVKNTRISKEQAEQNLQNDREQKKLNWQTEMSNLETQIQEFDSKINAKQREYAKLVQEQNTRLNGERSEITNLLNDITGINGEVYSLQLEQSKAEGYAKVCDQHLTNIDNLQTSIEETQRHIIKLNDANAEYFVDLSHVEWLVKNTPYIKLHKLSVSLMEMSKCANEYFDRMGDTMRINVKAFEQKKSSKSELAVDALKSEISLEVTDGEKSIHTNLYSDGEAARIAPALVWALQQLATQNGKGCNILLLDEVFSYVDPVTAQKVSEGLFSSLVCPTTFVTDNSGIVQDILSFDQSWVVRKTQGVSSLEVDCGA